MTNNGEQRAFTDIDLHQLHEEWLLQPRLRHEWSSKLADAKLDLAEAKKELELTEARLQRDIRADPATFGIDHVTEKAVTVRVVLHKKYQAAQTAVHQAQHKVDVIQAGLTAIDDRKKTLENLVTLFVQDYWADPKVPKGMTQDKYEEATQRLRRAENKRKKEAV